MPRRARLRLPGVPVHVIQRGNNRTACFFADQDYQLYLEWLGEYAKASGVLIHAYVLMTNHVHLLASQEDLNGIGQMMKRLGQRYVQYINREYRRSGTLWEGRYRSCLVDAEQYLLTCQRYIELNPVRARMVEHPAEYRWSSYRANAHGEANPLIQHHALYTALGRTSNERLSSYRDLFRYKMDPGMVDELREATNGNFCFGTDRFKKEVELMLGRRARPGKSGRPRKAEPL